MNGLVILGTSLILSLSVGAWAKEQGVTKTKETTASKEKRGDCGKPAGQCNCNRKGQENKKS